MRKRCLRFCILHLKQLVPVLDPCAPSHEQDAPDTDSRDMSLLCPWTTYWLQGDRHETLKQPEKQREWILHCFKHWIRTKQLTNATYVLPFSDFVALMNVCTRFSSSFVRWEYILRLCCLSECECLVGWLVGCIYLKVPLVSKLKVNGQWIVYLVSRALTSFTRLSSWLDTINERFSPYDNNNNNNNNNNDIHSSISTERQELHPGFFSSTTRSGSWNITLVWSHGFINLINSFTDKFH